jgi:hypothetical protein
MNARIALLGAAAALSACSQEPAGESAESAAAMDGPPEISVENGWVRATPGGNEVTAAYFTLVNAGGADRLVGAASAQLDEVQLHASIQGDGGVMRMEHLQDGVEIPAGGEAVFAPGGHHLMLFGAADLTLGDTVCIALDFEMADDRIACLPVMDDAPLQ